MKDTFISLAIILDEHDDLEAIRSYADFLEKNFTDHEILLLGTTPQNGIDALLKQVDKIRYLQISNTIEYEVLGAAALENAIGDITVIGNLKNLTLDVIMPGVERCFSGVDIVIGVSDIRRPLWYRAGSAFFRLMVSKIIQYNLPPNDSGLRFVSRRAANYVIASSRFHQNLFLLLNRSGYPIELLEYSTGGKQRKELSLIIIFRHAISLLILSSTKPLRFVNLLGLIASGVSLIFACYSILIHLFKDNVAQGWTTQVLFSSIQFFLLFLILTFLGEYLLRILSNQNVNSSYCVIFEKHSSVMLDTARLNVMNESTAPETNLTQTGRDR